MRCKISRKLTIEWKKNTAIVIFSLNFHANNCLNFIYIRRYEYIDKVDTIML
jgi:hypothetical protein